MQSGHVVYLINEARTSQMCSVYYAGATKHCKQHRDPHTGQMRYVWRLLQCQNPACRWILNRDKNTPFNLLLCIAETILDDEWWPAYPRRHSPSTSSANAQPAPSPSSNDPVRDATRSQSAISHSRGG